MNARRAHGDDGQATMIGLVLALVVVGALSAILLSGAITGGGTPASNGVANGAGVGTADDVAAKTTLSNVQTDVQSSEGATAGAVGYGALSPTAMQSLDPSGDDTFTNQASTSPTTVSMAASGGALGSGSVTFAVLSASGTCWYLWLGSGGPLYGAMTGQSSCQASALGTAPAVGPVSSSAIGWATGSFPDA